MRRVGRYEQQERCSWIGGHFTEPNEQKTQQSPALGFKSALQFSHS
jgi:hypothetical protein